MGSVDVFLAVYPRKHPRLVFYFTLARYCLNPFYTEIKQTSYVEDLKNYQFIRSILIYPFGIVLYMTHLLFGLYCAATFVGLTFAEQHFVMSTLALSPYSYRIQFKTDELFSGSEKILLPPSTNLALD